MDEREKAYLDAKAFGEAIPSNPYRQPELRIESRPGYPFAAPVSLPPDVSGSHLTVPADVSRSQLAIPEIPVSDEGKAAFLVSLGLSRSHLTGAESR